MRIFFNYLLRIKKKQTFTKNSKKRMFYIKPISCCCCFAVNVLKLLNSKDFLLLFVIQT